MTSGDIDREYETPDPSPCKQDQEYSYATSEDNPHIVPTYLAPGDKNKVSSGQDVDPKYEKTLSDMPKLPEVAGDTDQNYFLPSESPVNRDLKHDYATPNDNSWIRHSYLTFGDRNEAKHGFDFPSKSSGVQNIECVYVIPDGDPSNQDLGD